MEDVGAQGSEGRESKGTSLLSLLFLLDVTITSTSRGMLCSVIIKASSKVGCYSAQLPILFSFFPFFAYWTKLLITGK